MPVTYDLPDCFIVSLNRFEQALYDYLRQHPEEQRHWESKVVVVSRLGSSAPSRLAEDLSAYIQERGNHVEPFRRWLKSGRIPPSSLLNLAEYLLRMWTPALAPKRRG